MSATLPPIYSVAEIRTIEAAAAARTPQEPLMARAGAAAAARALELLGDRDKRVLVLAGPGNNGGDAFEVATLLKRAFLQVSCVFAGDAAKLPVDAARALDKWRAAGGELLAEIPPGRVWGLVVDGLFGIGLTRAISGALATLIEQANALGAPILALDIASGINADTGVAPGPAIRATHTITFIGLKPGLLTLDGPDHCGAIDCATLGLDPNALAPPRGHLADARVLADLPEVRPRNFHKGLAGSVAIFGGASGMAGALLLAGRAALKAGAGKVFLGFTAARHPEVDPLHPELMLRGADALLAAEFDAIAVGPGMGTDAGAERTLSQTLRVDLPLVLDADALNLLAQHSVLRNALAVRASATVLTPHPAEAARLLGCDTASVQADRVQAALEIAKRLAAAVVLKGNGSVIATADGRWWINTSGNPGMAAGGMGDALTGLIVSLIAQRLDAATAARVGVHVHGAAADRLVANGIGPLGLTASEVIDAARAILNRI